MNDTEIQRLLAPAASRPLPPPAFSLDDVVRRGRTVRRRRRTLASLGAVVLLVAAAAGVREARTSAAPAAPTPAEARTTAVVEYAVNSVPLPAGSHAIAPVPGLALRPPLPKDPGVHRTAWFLSLQTPETVGNWILAHGWDAGWNASLQSTPAEADLILDWYGQVEETDSPDPEVHVRVVARDGGSLIRVDGWQQPQDVPGRSASTLIGDAVTSVSLVRGGETESGPYSSTLTLTFDGERVRRLVRALDALPLSWSVDGRQCVTSSNVTLTFHRDGHTLVFVDAPACGFVRVTVDGKAQPPLTALNLPLQQAISALHAP